MTIRLVVQSEEPEVEALLTYLDSRYNAEPFQKIYLLERTLRWLQVIDPKPLNALGGISQLSVEAHETALAFSSHPHTPDQRPQHQPISQAVHRSSEPATSR